MRQLLLIKYGELTTKKDNRNTFINILCDNIYKSLNTSPTDYDIDHSNNIDAHESIFLGLALSIDSICVGIGSGIIGLNDIILPFLVATFQLAFLNCGNSISQKIVKYLNVSEQALSIFSSVILIIVGMLRIYK